MEDVSDKPSRYRAEWMTEDHWECARLVADLFRGFHNVPGKFRQLGSGIAISVTEVRWAASFDMDGLTRAVVMAHDRMIRFEVGPSSPKSIKLILHKRHKREGQLHDIHPTIEDAVEKVRSGRSW